MVPEHSRDREVDPEHIRVNTVPPVVQIEQVSVDGVPLNLSGEIDVKPGQEKFEFQYTASSLLVPERTSFNYRLEGFDKGWIDAGNRRTAYYTHLPPGSYTFQVTAANNDGVSSTHGAELRFRLEPRFFQTWWFRLLAILSLIAAAAALYRLRVGHLRRLAVALAQQVALRTQDLERANADLLQAKDPRRTRGGGEITVSRQHEPRNSHADERGDRDVRAAARYAS